MDEMVKQLAVARALLGLALAELDILDKNPKDQNAANRLGDYAEAAWTTARRVINEQDAE
jgi:hypothetical protein